MTIQTDLIDHLSIFARSGCPVHKFLLKKGRFFTAAKRPKGMRKRPNGDCYRSAGRLVLECDVPPLRYVEGVAVRLEIGFPLPHAWAVTRDGTVVDPTWKDPETAIYYGVAFDPLTLAKELQKWGFWGLLDGPRGPNRDLLGAK